MGTLPALALEARPTVTLKEIIDDFCTQMPTASQLMDNVMQSGAASFVIDCKSATNAEAVLHSGLCFHGHPISFKPAPNTQWIKLTRVVYGTSENAIKTRLSQHGSTSFPGSLLYVRTRRRDPGCGWSRVTQYLRGKSKFFSG